MDKKATVWVQKQYPTEFNLYPCGAFSCPKKKELIYFVSDNYDKKKWNGVIAFDSNSQQMKRLQAFPTNTSIHNGHSYCYHANSHKIFIYSPQKDEVISYDIASKQWSEHQIKEEIGRNASMICVEDTIHIFGGGDNEHHLMYDINTKSIRKALQLWPHKLEDTQCVHIPNTSTVFVIGGRHWSEEYKYSAWMCSVSFSGSARCSISGKYTMPKPLSTVAAIFVHPFILLFGGEDKDTVHDTIYSFDINKHEWRESSIKIPRKATYHAILANDKTIHLFARVSPCKHYSIPLSVLLNGQVLFLFLFNVLRVFAVFLSRFLCN